jgi:hypothetical protein
VTGEKRMNVVGAFAVIGLFIWLVHVLKLVTLAADAIAVSRRSAAVMRDAALDDDAKEAALQQGAVRLMKLALLMLVGSAVALAAPMAAVWLLELAGIMSVDGVVAILLRWDVLLLATVVGIGAFVALRKRRR